MISIISCTDRDNSYSRKVSNIVAAKLEALGVPTQILDLNDIDPSHIMGTYGNPSQRMEEANKKFVVGVDRIIMVVPEYNGGFPGILKYFIDICDPTTYKGKKVCLVGIGAGRGGNVRGIEHLTGVLHYLRAEVFSHKVYISLVEQMVDDNDEVDPIIGASLDEQLTGFINF
jgi:chromate reductase, NAD(P)H dehydrogenase (quinone)